MNLVSHDDLDHGVPADGVLAGRGRPMYHKHRGLATNEADRIKAVYGDRIRHTKIELEPNNGWVIVLFSDTPHDLDELSDKFEIRDGVKRPKPEYRVRTVEPVADKPAKREAATVGTPAKGATARVWVIADAYLAKLGRALGKEDRAEIIKQCEDAGINVATAATQYSKWKRTKGL